MTNVSRNVVNDVLRCIAHCTEKQQALARLPARHDEAAARDPEGALRHDEGGTGWTDGETYADVAERGTRALNHHSEGLAESDLLVIVAHGGLIGAVTGRIIGLTAEQQRVHLGRISHGHATYLRRRESPAGPIWRVLAYNAPLLGDAGPPIELTSH